MSCCTNTYNLGCLDHCGVVSFGSATVGGTYIGVFQSGNTSIKQTIILNEGDPFIFDLSLLNEQSDYTLTLYHDGAQISLTIDEIEYDCFRVKTEILGISTGTVSPTFCTTMCEEIYDPTQVGADVFDYNNLHTYAAVDGVTITGDGTTSNPFVSVGGAAFECDDLTGCNISLLTNDAGYLSNGDNVSELVNDANYLASGDNISNLVNDSGYLVSGDNVSSLTNDAGYLTTISGLNISELTNDAGYITAAITSLNGLTDGTQTFATGTAGTDFAISSALGVHTFDIPTASATNRGLLSTSDWSTFDGKQDNYTILDTLGVLANASGVLTNDGSGFLSWGAGGSTQYGGNNTLYVSKQGNDATGTKGDRSKPYLTISAAITAAVGGDVVLVMEGTYIENIALKDYVKLIAETWGAVTIQHAGTVNTYGISSPNATFLGTGIYYDIFIWGFRVTNPTGETTIKINAQKLIVKLQYLEAKSKNATYQSKIQCYASSTSSAVFECDVVDVNSISTTTQFGFDGISVPATIGSVYAMPSCYIKVLTFTEVSGGVPADFIGWQNWNWRVDAINSNTINGGYGFGEIYHQNCNGHVGTYRSIRTGSQGNNYQVFYMPVGNQTLTVDYFYSAGQEKVITCGAGNDIINIGWMETDGLIFISPEAGKTTILNAQTLKRINAKSTSIFYIFPVGAAGKVKLNCNYCQSNGSGSGTIYTYNTAAVAIDIYLSGEFYNSNSSNSLVIQDDASAATVKYKINGSAILRNNQAAATKAWGTFNHATSLYINGGLGVTNTNAGTAPTVVTGSITTDVGL